MRCCSCVAIASAGYLEFRTMKDSCSNECLGKQAHATDQRGIRMEETTQNAIKNIGKQPIRMIHPILLIETANFASSSIGMCHAIPEQHENHARKNLSGGGLLLSLCLGDRSSGSHLGSYEDALVTALTSL